MDGLLTLGKGGKHSLYEEGHTGSWPRQQQGAHKALPGPIAHLLPV